MKKAVLSVLFLAHLVVGSSISFVGTDNGYPDVASAIIGGEIEVIGGEILEDIVIEGDFLLKIGNEVKKFIKG